MKRCLITGGTGFVGANLTRRLLADGHDVHLLARPEHAAWRINDIRSAVDVHIANLDNKNAVTAAFSAVRPEWVFDLAAHGAYSWQRDVRQMVQTNIVGAINLIEAALEAGVEAIVRAGSSSEYGLKDHPPAEQDWLDPNSDYAWTKGAATLYCRYTARVHDVPIHTLRLYSVYGPFEEPRRLLPTLILRGLDGELPPLVDPSIARDYVYVDDVCDAFVRVATHRSSDPGAVYNVGTGLQTTLREIVDVAMSELPITHQPSWGTMPNRDWDTSVWVADPTLIERELGWAPRFKLADGFRAMVQWFRDNPAMLAYYRSNIAPGPTHS